MYRRLFLLQIMVPLLVGASVPAWAQHSAAGAVRAVAHVRASAQLSVSAVAAPAIAPTSGRRSGAGGVEVITGFQLVENADYQIAVTAAAGGWSDGANAVRLWVIDATGRRRAVTPGTPVVVVNGDRSGGPAQRQVRFEIERIGRGAPAREVLIPVVYELSAETGLMSSSARIGQTLRVAALRTPQRVGSDD